MPERPFAVEPVTLEGAGVRLEPLSRERHRVGIAAAIRDGDLWNLWVTTVPHPDDLDAWFDDAGRALRAGRELTFATIDSTRDVIVGSTRFRTIEAVHRRVEIGFTFLAVGAQRSHVNTAAKLLMLEHAFGTWEVNRVELLTDDLNGRSKSAIVRIGARPEGVLRSHMVMADGRVRDSAVFSIVRAEWPGLADALRARLGT